MAAAKAKAEVEQHERQRLAAEAKAEAEGKILEWRRQRAEAEAAGTEVANKERERANKERTRRTEEARVRLSKLGPTIFRGGSSTDGGFYPLPSYPRDALLRKESGDVQAYVEVAEDGTPSKVEIRISSGSSTLDQTFLSQIRKLWRWPVSPGGAVRQYLVPFEFRLGN